MCELVRRLFSPFPHKTFRCYIVPGAGTICHGLLGVQTICPDISKSYVDKQTCSSLLLTGATVGVTYYLFDRNQMKIHSTQYRIAYSFYFAGIFNVGSIWFFKMFKWYLPETPIIRILCGVFGSLFLLTIGKRYFIQLEGNSN